MLKKEVLESLNKQIGLELQAMHEYLGLAIYFEQELLKGFAAWFHKQTEEEREHAMRLIEYVQDRGGKVKLGAVPAVETHFASPLEAVKGAYAAECRNTAGINNCCAVAAKADDLATQNMLQWFVAEQVEEEKWSGEFVALVEKVSSSVGALYQLDHTIGKAAEKKE